MGWKTGNPDVEGPGHRKLKRGEVESGKGARVLREQDVGVGSGKDEVEQWEGRGVGGVGGRGMEEGGRGGEIMRMEERGNGRGSVETEEWKSGGVEKSRTGSGRIE